MNLTYELEAEWVELIHRAAVPNIYVKGHFVQKLSVRSHIQRIDRTTRTTKVAGNNL